MLFARIMTALRCFRHDTRGTVTVEAVIAVPLLFFAAAATFEFFEVHRYKSAREKASYTVADLLSRETSETGVTSTYVDNAKILFDEIANDDGVNELRITVLRYHGGDDIYQVSWSQVRGVGSLEPLTTAEVSNAHDTLPILDAGEELILVESESDYIPTFTVGLRELVITTRYFVSLRFASQVCFEGVCGPQGPNLASEQVDLADEPDSNDTGGSGSGNNTTDENT